MLFTTAKSKNCFTTRYYKYRSKTIRVTDSSTTTILNITVNICYNGSAVTQMVKRLLKKTLQRSLQQTTN